MMRILIASGLLLAACGTSTLTVRSLKVAPPSSKLRVVVLKSSAQALYREPVSGFVANMDAEIVEITMDEWTSEDAAAAAVTAQAPALIYALGARAALVAAHRLPQTPVVCAMAIDYRASKLHTFANISGVALEIPALQEFSQYKIVMPKLRRVLVIHSQAMAERVAAAQKSLAPLAIELEAAKIVESRDLVGVLASRLKQVDAVWLTNDPVAFNRTAFNTIRAAANEARVPLLASLPLAEEGAFAAVSFDFTLIGAQAATLARSLLDAPTKHPARFQPPLSVQLTLNTSVAKALKIDVPEDALPLVRTVGSDKEK